MADSKTLRQIFHTSAVVGLDQHDGNKRKAVLRPEGEKGSSIEIVFVPDDMLVVRVDEQFKNDELISGLAGSCRRADYIMVSPKGRKIFFVEMKTTLPDDTQTPVIQKLKGALCVLRYCQAIADQFHGNPNFLSDQNYEWCFLAIALKMKFSGMRPTKTKRGKNPHGTPESYGRLFGKSLRYIEICK